MNILLIDNGTTLLKKLQDLIPGSEVTQKWNNVVFENDKDFDLIVLSGGSAFPVFGNDAQCANERELIKNFSGPIIGICFGAELIANTFGGQLVELPEKVKGLREISVIKDDPIFSGNKSLEVYESHGWAIKSLPEDFEILATSKNGIEVFKSKLKPIYGFQFHPENMTDVGGGDEVFLNAINRLVKTKA